MQNIITQVLSLWCMWHWNGNWSLNVHNFFVCLNRNECLVTFRWENQQHRFVHVSTTLMTTLEMLLVPSYWNTSLSASFSFSEMDIGFDLFQCHQHSEIQQIQISQSSGCTTAQGKNLNNLKDSERFVVKLYWEPWDTNKQWMVLCYLV